MQIFSQFTVDNIHLKPFPFKRERSMQEYLIENEGILRLDDKDTFSDVRIVVDELKLQDGRQANGTDGRLDILATYSQEYIAIIELKNEQLTDKHLTQLEDYLQEKNQISKKYPDILDPEVGDPKWIGVLVGPSIEIGLSAKITNGDGRNLGIPIAALTLQRFRGEDGRVYVTTSTYFKQPSSKDNSKYSYDGRVFGKGKLVLEVVKRYVADHPDLRFSDLEQVFPKSCQGSLGVFATREAADSIVQEKNRLRHFLKPEELIELSDVSIAVCNQWGIKNINNFIDIAKTKGYVITLV